MCESQTLTPSFRKVVESTGADGFLSKPFDHSELLVHVRSFLSLKAYTDELERAESVLFALAGSIEGKDPYTEGHCERLSGYSVRLGERIGLPEDQVIALRRAGIIHDIDSEQIMETHPQLLDAFHSANAGCQICTEETAVSGFVCEASNCAKT